MKRLLIAGAVLSFMPAAAFAADMSGSWKIDANFGDAIKFSITCALTETSGALAGTCTGPQGESLKATGTADATKAVISYDTTYQGGPIHLDYKGDVQPDGSLKGVIEAGGAEGAFTAVKQ
ncbi:MAG: hypothetical protein ACHP7N_07260 [Caulobacterales bacterium]